MNLNDIRIARKYGCTIMQLFCTKCGMRKFIVSNENYNAHDLDAVSKCCNKPDYRL